MAAAAAAAAHAAGREVPEPAAVRLTEGAGLAGGATAACAVKWCSASIHLVTCWGRVSRWRTTAARAAATAAAGCEGGAGCAGAGGCGAGGCTAGAGGGGVTEAPQGDC